MNKKPASVLRFSGEAAFVVHRRTALRVDERAMTVFVLPSADSVWRFAAVASKRIGGAVERNRAKRRLRAAFAEVYPTFKKPLSVIIYAKAGALKVEFKELISILQKILARV